MIVQLPGGDTLLGGHRFGWSSGVVITPENRSLIRHRVDSITLSYKDGVISGPYLHEGPLVLWSMVPADVPANHTIIHTVFVPSRIEARMLRFRSWFRRVRGA